MHDPRLFSARILAVDDEEPNLRVLRRHLVRAGFQAVDTTPDPTEALRRVTADPPDLLVLDLNMPGLDGYTLLERIRPQLEAGRGPAVLVLSGEAAATSRQRVIDAGAGDFVSKPYDAADLVSRILALLLTHDGFRSDD
jgi:two-component system response regulator MprA